MNALIAIQFSVDYWRTNFIRGEFASLDADRIKKSRPELSTCHPTDYQHQAASG